MSRLEQAQQRCAEITRRRGANFSVGFELLPQPQKNAVHACYAFCRLVDDLVDESPGEDVTDALEEWRAELDRSYAGDPRHEVGLALADAVQRYPVPRQAFLELIEGCEADLDFQAPQSLDDLYHYCDLVATPIGAMSLAIFGGHSDHARQLGRELSLALQLTNILRDVKEDAERGRVYLPAEWMEEHGVSAAQLAGSPDGQAPDEKFVSLMQQGIDCARRHYQAARDLPLCVDQACRPAVVLMGAVYESILERIAEDPTAVLRQRVGLDDSEKTLLVRRLLTGSGQSNSDAGASTHTA